MTQLLQAADSVAREKNIAVDEVLKAMEVGIQKAGRSLYGHENDIRAFIDRKTGDIRLYRYREVTDSLENESTQLLLEDARQIKADAEIGEFITDELPPIEFGRVAAQTAKQVISQKVREAERRRQYEEFKDRVGEIINGTVKRIEYGNVTVDLGRAEAVIRRDELIPREHLKNGDRVRAYIHDVRQEVRGPQIFLSRTHPEFMSKLFMQEVPEIYDGIIEVKAVARDPGSRAKIAVKSHDSSIDPVGACVGLRGSRVQAVVSELQGEKIDIVPWTEDRANFLISALAPAQVSKVVLDEDGERIEVVVPDDQLSLAIGRRGQNVRLASILCGADIDILTEASETERRQEEFSRRSERFMEALDVDDVIAALLVAEGFRFVDELCDIDLTELSNIEGFDESVAEELQNRARDYVEARNSENAEKLKQLGLSDDLVNHESFTDEMLVALGENDVKTLDDLADLAGDELVEIIGAGLLTVTDANNIIMKAREHWFAADEDDSEEA